jgi:hypothetical protein
MLQLLNCTDEEAARALTIADYRADEVVAVEKLDDGLFRLTVRPDSAHYVSVKFQRMS